jgi:DUF4097 and DUF4098 domain-containing protein YvlB
MGAYPPNSPNSPNTPYSPPPPYSREARRAQRRAIKDQARFQQAQYRNQMRMQRRVARRGSIVGPLLLVALGVVFLLAQTGIISWSRTMLWYGRWWPAILIAAGLVLLAEWALDQRRQEVTGARPVRVMGGGVVLLLILLVLVGFGSDGVEAGLAWRDHTFGHGFGDLDHVLGDRHDGYSSMSATLPPGGSLRIGTPRGDVTVTGASPDGQVHVSVHTQAYAWKDSEADSKTQRLRPTLSRQGNDLVLSVAAVDGGRADLTVAVPATTAVIVNASHGDVNISQLKAPVTLSAGHGDVGISQIGAGVTATISDDDANLTLHSIAGPVTIEGRSGDIDIADITGTLEMQGDFYGTTDLKHVTGPVRFETSRTRFSAARLDGEFSVENDSLDASAMLGPVVLKTSDKNITLDRVQGDVSVADDNGSVEVTNAPPAGAVNIQNQHGSVDVGMPAASGFVLNAQTRNGDMENDFGLTPQDQSDDSHTLRGTVGSGGPTVTIATSDGDVTVRKSTVAPLPPTPPDASGALSQPAVPGPPHTRKPLRSYSF